MAAPTEPSRIKTGENGASAAREPVRWLLRWGRPRQRGRGPPVPSVLVSVPRVYVCTEKGCGKRSDHRELSAELVGAAEVVGVSCQSVCDGPVAGVVVEGRLQWFEKVRTRKSRAGVRRMAEDGRGALPGALAKRRRSKRAGKLRG